MPAEASSGACRGQNEARNARVQTNSKTLELLFSVRSYGAPTKLIPPPPSITADSMINSSSPISCGLGAPFDVLSCGGHGDCVVVPEHSQAVCQRIAGWSGSADFQVSNDLIDYSISIVGVQCLWAINLLVTLGIFVKSVPSIYRAFKKHSHLQKEARSRGRLYTISSNKGLLSILPCLFLGLPCQLIMAAFKIAYPTRVIGQDVVPTLLWWTVRTTFYFAVFRYQSNLLESLLATKFELTKVVKRNHQFSNVLFFVTVCIQFIAIWPMAQGSSMDLFFPLPGLLSSAIYMFMFGSTFILVGIQAVYVKRSAIIVFDESLEVSRDQRTLDMKIGLVHAQDAFKIQLFFQGFCYLCCLHIRTCGTNINTFYLYHGSGCP